MILSSGSAVSISLARVLGLRHRRSSGAGLAAGCGVGAQEDCPRRRASSASIACIRSSASARAVSAAMRAASDSARADSTCSARCSACSALASDSAWPVSACSTCRPELCVLASELCVLANELCVLLNRGGQGGIGEGGVDSVEGEIVKVGQRVEVRWPEAEARQQFGVDHAVGVGRDLLILSPARRQPVETHMRAAGVEDRVLLHPGQRIVALLLLSVAQHLRQRRVGQELDNAVADAAKRALLDPAPRRRVAVQDDADVGLAHLLTEAGLLLRVRQGEEHAGLHVDQVGDRERFQEAGQEDEKPESEIELRLVGQWFRLQDAVVPLVADVEVAVGAFVPVFPVLFQRDAAPLVGGREGGGGRVEDGRRVEDGGGRVLLDGGGPVRRRARVGLDQDQGGGFLQLSRDAHRFSSGMGGRRAAEPARIFYHSRRPADDRPGAGFIPLAARLSVTIHPRSRRRLAAATPSEHAPASRVAGGDQQRTEMTA